MKAAAIQLNSKLDLAKTDKTYYTAPNHPQIVTLPKLTYLAVTDKGSPDSPIFARTTEALYKLAYSVKAICKADGCDFTVPKLEGLWWVESEQKALEVPREEWHWKLFIQLPDFAQSDQIEDARRQAIAKNKGMDTLQHVTFEAMEEGMSVQMMHVGPYSTELETINQIHAFMETKKLVQSGLHHEIYLSDPRKVDPAVLKTILRLPVRELK